MKIITGISNSHTPEEIEAYAKAGVDEFFVGYVPDEWSQEYGYEISCNRREHSNCQYRSRSELENLVKLVHDNGRKLFLTLNAHEYSYTQFKLLHKILNSIGHIPIDGFIVSNLAMMLELRRVGIDKPFNISIGAGSNSIEAIDFYANNVTNINRFILPRKFTLSEIKKISDYAREKSIDIEAFLLGDPCHFNDEYCFTWHGASNDSLCNSPMYKHKELSPIILDYNWKNSIYKEPLATFMQKHYKILESSERQKSAYYAKKPGKQMGAQEMGRLNILSRMNKCGLCAISKFQEWGVGSIKLPLRGYFFQTNLEVISLVKTILNTPDASPVFCQKLLATPSFCLGENCYYDYPYSN
jgi:U32 family peptidase